jgi:hypothetical protein
MINSRLSRAGFTILVFILSIAGVLLLSRLDAIADAPTDPDSVASREPLESYDTPVVLDYFYEPGCPECRRVSREVLPELQTRYEGFYSLNRHDVGIVTNLVKLIAYQKALGIEKNSSVSIVVDYAQALCGFDDINDNLFASMDSCVVNRMQADWVAPEVILWGQSPKAVEERASSFGYSAIWVAGLIDGINPCAISTLVFFMSMLLVAKVSRSGLLLMGLSFCLASFITYTAIGFGLLRCLHMLESFPLIQTVFETMLAGTLVILAFISIGDAIRYRRTHDPKQVALQLPPRVKTLIQSIIRKGVKSHYLLVGGFAAGSAVTALETVCTGQVYVPALTVIISEGGGTHRVWSLLLLYNGMFILPLIVAFILVSFGLTTERMLTWSRRNLPLSKTLLAIFFIAIALYLLW